MEAITIDTVDTLVTAALAATESNLASSAVSRADELGARILRAAGNASPYCWVPVAEVAATAWTPATANAVESARLAFFEQAELADLERDPDLWSLLANLGSALAFRTDRPVSANSVRPVIFVRDVFALPLLPSIPPTVEGF